MLALSRDALPTKSGATPRRCAGAFALTGGENAHQTWIVQTLAPGVYTVRVSDAAAQGGNVLIEVYELP